MSGRVFVTPQGGRAARTGSVPGDDEPWGTTSSRAQFRAYEPAEVRSCRSTVGQLQPYHEATDALSPQARGEGGGRPGGASRRGSSQRGTPGRQTWSSLGRDDASAVTALTQSATGSGSRAQGASQQQRPAWAQERPIPENRFDGTSTYREHHEQAQAARHGYFPGRDEFAPRSKRLLYEMALARCSRDSVKSASSCAGTESCFTVATKAKTGVSQGSAGGRSASTPNLQQPRGPSPPGSADSQRILGGVGSLARRRKEAQLRAPTLWAPDHEWMQEKLETDGAAGLHTHNMPAKLHKANLTQFGEQMLQVNNMILWSAEPGVGNLGSGFK